MQKSTLVNTDISCNLIELFKTCRGYYKCPEGSNGELLGPLVGYVGNYLDEQGGGVKHFVGKEYFNFAKVERHHRAVDRFAATAVGEFFQLPYKKFPTVVLAAPMGGIIFGQHIARRLDIRYAFAEKKVTKVATEGHRDDSYLDLDRHEIEPEDVVILTEDVAHNLTTVNGLIRLVEERGAEVIGIISALNISGFKHWTYPRLNLDIPITASLFHPIEQWRQDHPNVSDHIHKDNVVWRPKSKLGWARLENALLETCLR